MTRTQRESAEYLYCTVHIHYQDKESVSFQFSCGTLSFRQLPLDRKLDSSLKLRNQNTTMELQMI